MPHRQQEEEEEGGVLWIKAWGRREMQPHMLTMCLIFLGSLFCLILIADFLPFK